MTHARGWLVAGALGLLGGYLVGAGAMAGYTHAMWPASAGIAAGAAGALATPAQRVLVGAFGGSVAVAAAVTKIACVQLERGHWPVTDDFTLAHYGSATQAAARATILLGIQIAVPCLIAAALVARSRRGGTDAHEHP